MSKEKKIFLTPAEVTRVLNAAKNTRHAKRDYLIFLLTYRHGLRVSELIALRTNDINIEEATIQISRSKGGRSNIHPLQPDELRPLKAYLAEHKHPYLFLSERGTPFSRFGIVYLCQAVGAAAKLPDLHPHMLRHSCGYYLVNKGYDLRLIQDYLGHRSIASTVRYTQVNHERFQNLFRH